MEYNYYNLFLFFFIYSIIGYIVESTSVSLTEKKIVLNRGFLIGPYIPIFGYGSIAMILALQKYKNDIIALFIMSMIVCLTIEYLCSLIAEKIFHLRWWDYSNKKFNINGRICLQNGVLFGLAGVLVVRYINPWLESLILLLPNNVLMTISIILSIIFYTDTIISGGTVIKFNKSFKRYGEDNTGEVKNKIVEELHNNFLTKRLINAFPHAKDKSHKFRDIRRELINKAKEARQMKKEQRQKQL